MVRFAAKAQVWRGSSSWQGWGSGTKADGLGCTSVVLCVASHREAELVVFCACSSASNPYTACSSGCTTVHRRQKYGPDKGLDTRSTRLAEKIETQKCSSSPAGNEWINTSEMVSVHLSLPKNASLRAFRVGQEARTRGCARILKARYTSFVGGWTLESALSIP